MAQINAQGEVHADDALERLWNECPAETHYWLFVRNFLRIFISAASIADKIRMAGYVLSYLALWRWMIKRCLVIDWECHWH